MAVAQSFDYGIVSSGGRISRLEGSIIIQDSVVTMATSNDTVRYYLLRTANLNTYFTNGSMIHFFTITPNRGEQRGYEFDTQIVMTFDSRQSNQKVTYYCRMR